MRGVQIRALRRYGWGGYIVVKHGRDTGNIFRTWQSALNWAYSL